MHWLKESTGKSPDFRVGKAGDAEKILDVVAPNSTDPAHVAERIRSKVATGQADKILVDIDWNGFDISDFTDVEKYAPGSTYSNYLEMMNTEVLMGQKKLEELLIMKEGEIILHLVR